MRLALLPVAFEDLDDRLRKPVPGASILDEVIHHLVEGLPSGLFHPLFQPAPGLKWEASADVGELDRPRASGHAKEHIRSGTKHEAQMKNLWTRVLRRVPSRVPHRVPRRVSVKQGTRRGTLEGTLRGRQNLASARSAWPRPPPPPRDCKGGYRAGLRPDPAPPTTWVVGCVLRLVVRRLEKRRGGVGRGQKWRQ